MSARARTTTASSEDLSRLLSFSDGVFAIAITLLVLNLHPPVLQAHQTLAQALADQGKDYLSYAFSFLLIGQVWINHRCAGYFPDLVAKD
jgi:uncharacterized membrane protein